MDSTPLQILILNYEYPPLGGGAGVISKQQAEGLAEHGHQVTVLTCSEIDIFYREHPRPNLKVIRLGAKRSHQFRSSIGEKLDWMRKAQRYVQKMDSSELDACIAHFSIPGGWVAYQLHKSTGLPYFVISHGQDIPWFYPRQMFLYHLITAYPIKRILKKAKGLWVQSSQMLENAQKFLGPEASAKIQKIPNGCDPKLFHPSATKKPRGSSLKILFAGRLTRQKRPEKLIHAAQILKERKVPFQLSIAGDGVLRKKLENMAQRANLANEVHFQGWIGQKKIRELYRQNDVLLAPSEAEGMSITVLEALCSGLYVITTPVSGNPDLITPGINGDLVKNQPEELAKALENFKDQGEKYDVQRAEVLATFREKYAWKNIVKSYEKAIRNAIH